MVLSFETESKLRSTIYKEGRIMSEFENEVMQTQDIAEPVVEKKGFSIASLVLGLCGLLAWCIPLFGYPVCITGLVLGILGIKKGGKGMAIAGIALSTITLLITIGNSVLGALMVLNSGMF